MYTENRADSRFLRQGYLDEMMELLHARSRASAAIRDQFMPPEALAADREGYRRKFYEMLGWPLTEPRPAEPPEAEKSVLGQGDGYDIFRVRLAVLPNLHLNTLLFVPSDLKEDEKLPGIISQHGGLGSPELISGIWGDTFNYNDMTRRILKHRSVVIAPQLLIWPHDGAHDEPQFDRHLINNALRQQGSSIMGLETYALTRVLDYLESLDIVDTDHLGMIGLSYGGYYTILTAAADTRIKAAISSCSFNRHYGDQRRSISDWCTTNAANTFMDAETAALAAPRALAIQVGEKDELFDYKLAQEEFSRLLPYYKAQGAEDRLSFRVFDGPHEFDKAEDDLNFFFKYL